MNDSKQTGFSENITPMQAVQMQLELKDRVRQLNEFTKLEYVCGIDLSIIKKHKKLICGIVNFKYPEMETVERVSKVVDETFPYIPGLLSFREGPAIIETLMDLKHEPDLLVFDGQGIAHPRGLGIASHIGIIFDKPAMGIAKKRLFGEYTEPEKDAGSFTHLLHTIDKKVIGAALRTKKNVKPVFVSVGHKITLDKSIELAKEFTKGYRIPEPTRQAHIFVNEVRKQMPA